MSRTYRHTNTKQVDRNTNNTLMFVQVLYYTTKCWVNQLIIVKLNTVESVMSIIALR